MRREVVLTMGTTGKPLWLHAMPGVWAEIAQTHYEDQSACDVRHAYPN